MSAVAVALAALLLQAAPVFAPPIDVPIRYRVEEVRSDPRGARRFALDRQVVFTRTAVGLFATVTLMAVEGDAPADPKRVFDRAMAALIGKPLVFTLDRQGSVIAVEVDDPLWTMVVDTLAKEMLGPAADPGRGAHVAQMLAPLRTASSARRAGMLAGALTPLLTPSDIGNEPGPTRAVTVTKRTAGGGSVPLIGQEHVERLPDATLRLFRTVVGDAHDMPGSTMRVESETTLDPATGLSRGSRETVTITGGAATMTTTRTVVISR